MHIHVLLTAYKTAEYLSECIESILSQQDVQVTILVGIDGCPETLEAALKHKAENVHIYYFPVNHGTFITFNSLLNFVPENAYVQRFDSDDIMDAGMLATMAKHVPCYSKYSGISLIPKRLYDMVGGFRPWRMAADTEFRQRLLHVAPQYKQLPQMFFRREHEGQLTQSPEYGFGTPRRLELVDFIERQRRFRKKEIRIPRIVHPDVIKY